MGKTSVTLFAVTFFLLGCGKSQKAIVTGTVTWEGQPLEKGFLTFFPMDKEENTRGCEILNGQYQVSDLAPGKKRALIVASPRFQVQTGPEGRSVAAISPSEKLISPHAPGNQQIVEIIAGKQVLNFQLSQGSP